jgi:thiosulfate reductase cytochrome b subunit
MDEEVPRPGKHARVIRWTHWLNIPFLSLMVWSGLLIYWANDVYRIGWGGVTLVRFFPRWFYDALGIPGRLAEGMSIHFAVMWLFAANGLCYVIALALSGEWRNILPDKDTPREALGVVLHDLGLRKEPLPARKFNGAQRIAYTGALLLGAGSIVTGIAIYKPVQASRPTEAMGGYEVARLLLSGP